MTPFSYYHAAGPTQSYYHAVLPLHLQAVPVPALAAVLTFLLLVAAVVTTMARHRLGVARQNLSGERETGRGRSAPASCCGKY